MNIWKIRILKSWCLKKCNRIVKFTADVTSHIILILVQIIYPHSLALITTLLSQRKQTHFSPLHTVALYHQCAVSAVCYPHELVQPSETPMKCCWNSVITCGRLLLDSNCTQAKERNISLGPRMRNLLCPPEKATWPRPQIFGCVRHSNSTTPMFLNHGRGVAWGRG